MSQTARERIEDTHFGDLDGDGRMDVLTKSYNKLNQRIQTDAGFVSTRTVMDVASHDFSALKTDINLVFMHWYVTSLTAPNLIASWLNSVRLTTMPAASNGHGN